MEAGLPFPSSHPPPSYFLPSPISPCPPHHFLSSTLHYPLVFPLMAFTSQLSFLPPSPPPPPPHRVLLADRTSQLCLLSFQPLGSVQARNKIFFNPQTHTNATHRGMPHTHTPTNDIGQLFKIHRKQCVVCVHTKENSCSYPTKKMLTN